MYEKRTLSFEFWGSCQEYNINLVQIKGDWKGTNTSSSSILSTRSESCGKKIHEKYDMLELMKCGKSGHIEKNRLNRATCLYSKEIENKC